MDPLTGLVALTGISLASLAALRLKEGSSQEGFAVLPGARRDGYPTSIEESQTRYNKLTGMVNPLINGIIPVDSSQSTIQRNRSLVSQALSGLDSKSGLRTSRTLDLKFKKNALIPRADGDKSIFGAMKFCREAAQSQQPFSLLDAEGNVVVGKEGAVSKDGNWKFDEVCGICLTGGVDEEGRTFKGRKGMLIDPDSREAAISEATIKGLPYPRAKPSVAECNGAPQEPNFATNQKDLVRFQKRLDCMKRKSIDPQHQCGLCYENDVFSYVDPDAETSESSFVLQGFGTVVVKIQAREIARLELKENETTTVPLIGAKENDIFRIEISSSDSNKLPTVYGYFEGINPNGGSFTMPLNLLVTVDDAKAGSGSLPNKAGGFYTFTNVNLETAKIRPLTGLKTMALRGTIPFTFVSGNEFSAIDCPSAPYQTNIKSVNAFATDQPCFAKGSKPGNYNRACLQSRILDVGCTNTGSLFQNPEVLNTKDGKPQSLAEIYSFLEDIKDNDMIDPIKTKQCSGRNITTPCDPFIAKPGLRFTDILASTSNPGLKAQAQQCLSFLYNNKGANEEGPTPRVGPTYSGLTTYVNNRKEVKNIVCLPEGELNPDTSATALNTLATIADRGYDRKTGIEAVRAYLNNTLQTAVDMTLNANTDPNRRAAIRNCFGRELKNMPGPSSADPTVIEDPCGVMARYVQVLGGTNPEGFVQVSQLVVIDKNGTNVALKKDTSQSSLDFYGAAARYAVDGRAYVRENEFYHSRNVGPSQKLVVDLGQEYDITRVLYFGRGNAGLGYRNAGGKLQLLDSQKNVVAEQAIAYSNKQDFPFLQDPDKAGCKSEIPPPPPIAIPTGFANGLYVSFYDVTQSNPDPNTVSGNGWGVRASPPKAYSRIHLGDQYNNTLDKFPKNDYIGLTAKGYYFASGPGQLQLGTVSDDGILVKFNGQNVISNWNLHGPTWNESSVINIPAAGKYPIELSFYEWEGGAVCALYFKSENESDWKNDLTGRFAYSVQEANDAETAYQAILQQRAAAEKAVIEAKLATARANLPKMRIQYWNGARLLGTYTPVKTTFAFNKNNGLLYYAGEVPDLVPGYYFVSTENNLRYTQWYRGSSTNFESVAPQIYTGSLRADFGAGNVQVAFT